MAAKQQTRAQIDGRYKWRLEDIYATETDWDDEFAVLEAEIPSLEGYKGKLTDSAGGLYDALKAIDNATFKAERLYVYARMRRDEDNAHQKYASLADRAYGIMVKLSSAVSFVSPELTAADPDRLRGFLAENSDLGNEYGFMINEVLRAREHILDEKCELLLAMSHEFSSGPKEIFTMLENADLSFGTVKNDQGEREELTHGKYQVMLQSKNRNVRRSAYKTYYKAFRSMINTIAATYSTSVKKDVFYSRARGYGSALEAALFGDNVPKELYLNLLSAMHENMSIMYDYVALRRELLGIRRLRMYDIFAPLTDVPHKEYDYDTAVSMVLEALTPLGDDYIEVLKSAFSEGWVDVYETKGKTSGAYSWGVYGTHPYVLLNHRGDLNSVFTLAHEMGHAMHTYYSNEALPYSTAGYTIFVAEVASTVNEILLTKHLLKTTRDEELKKYILCHYLDQFRTTVFRQAMFAEFELKSHEMAEAGVPLTPENLSAEYGKLNSLYYGPQMTADDDICCEWARIPHFYNAFYVYKYATGFSCAVQIANDIEREGAPAAQRYRSFLEGGGSDFPLELLKRANVDLATGEPVRECMRAFGEALEQFKALVK